jgi:hypothetical protein
MDRRHPLLSTVGAGLFNVTLHILEDRSLHAHIDLPREPCVCVCHSTPLCKRMPDLQPMQYHSMKMISLQALPYFCPCELWYHGICPQYDPKSVSRYPAWYVFPSRDIIILFNHIVSYSACEDQPIWRLVPFECVISPRTSIGRWRIEMTSSNSVEEVVEGHSVLPSQYAFQTHGHDEPPRLHVHATWNQ